MDINNTDDDSMTRNCRIVEVITVEQNLTTTNTNIGTETDVGPIVGYAEVPLLPLGKACAPLISIIQDLSIYIEQALNETPEEPSDGLTVDESAAIRLYTIEWQKQHQSLYSMLNHTLRTADRKDLQPYFKYLKLFLTAMAKLPCIPPQTVWRGVTKDLSAHFLPDTRVTWWAFSSCTRSMSVLKSKMYLGNTGPRTLFSVEAINGRTIRAHSRFARENEIILLPGTHMVFQTKLNPAPDLHIIHLKQVIPKETLLELPFKGAHLYPKVERHFYQKKRFIIPMSLVAIVFITAAVLGYIYGLESVHVCENPYTIAMSYPTGHSPRSVTLGYFTNIKNNTEPVLTVANQDDDTVSILLGNGDGTFHAEYKYATGVGPASVISGDFNNDKKLDLAVANRDENTVTVLLGNADETFQSQITYPTGTYPMSVISNDFNNDKILDLVVANADDNTVSLLLGNADGTFQTQTTYATGSYPVSMISGDFNNDNILDLAVTNGDDKTVSVLLGNADGTFETQITYATGRYPVSVTSDDFNNDNNLDLAVANGNNKTVSLLLGNGDGTFKTQITYATGGYPESVISGDFNNDKKLDLVVANADDNTISVLLGKGDGTFETQITYVTGSYPVSVISGHLNSDDKLDLVVTNKGSEDVSVFLNKCT